MPQYLWICRGTYHLKVWAVDNLFLVVLDSLHCVGGVGGSSLHHWTWGISTSGLTTVAALVQAVACGKIIERR